MKMSILPDAYSETFTGRRRRKSPRFLPEEILENIFTRLPVKSIIRFRCVSKYWLHQFQNPNFIKNHLNHAIRINNFNILLTNTFDYSRVLWSTSSPFLSRALNIEFPLMSELCFPQILGSSNGLVPIAVNEEICIWNPATRECKLVPGLSTDVAGIRCVRFDPHGFGFDSKNNDYKLLRILTRGRLESFEALLYSFASNSWKNLGFIPYELYIPNKKGFLLNGVLHWIAADTLPDSAVIVCFDIADETFFDVPLPPFDLGDLFQCYLGVWEGKLCLLHENHMEKKDPDICTHQNDHTDVWVIIGNKWSKHWKITAHMREMRYRRPIQTLQNGEILFEGESRVGVEKESFDLISYDPKLERARALKMDGFPEQLADTEVETYIETLVALHSGTHVGQ